MLVLTVDIAINKQLPFKVIIRLVDRKSTPFQPP